MIELLVVIAIIAILAAILLPALQNAKVEAKSIACKNIMRQYGLASMNYEANYDGYTPRAIVTNPGVQWCLWPEFKEAFKGLYTSTQGWEKCPGRPETRYQPTPLDINININPVYYSGGTNFRLVRLRKPDKTAFWCDAPCGPSALVPPEYCNYYASHFDVPTLFWAYMRSGALIPPYHGKFFNVWYWDGHTDALPRFSGDSDQEDLFKWKK